MEENKLRAEDDYKQIILSQDTFSKCLKENRRREMFEKVALAMIARETPWSWQDCTKQTESLLREADKFAKGE